MKKPFLLPLCFCLPSRPVLAKTDPALQQTLLSAIERADLTHDQTEPFQLEVDFVAQFNESMRGHLTLKWAARDLWWRKVVIGGFQQIEIRNGDWRYIARNANFTPFRVQELIDLLDLNPKAGTWSATKEKRRVEHGVDMSCIHAELTVNAEHPPNYRKTAHDFCLSSASNDLILEEWREAPDELHTKQYSDYFEFGAHRFPHKLQLQERTLNIISADVVSLAAATFDASQFLPPPDAIARRDCDDRKPPALIKAPELEFSPSAREKGGGDIMVTMTVLTDGSVSDIQLAGSSGIPLEPETIKTLRHTNSSLPCVERNLSFPT